MLSNQIKFNIFILLCILGSIFTTSDSFIVGGMIGSIIDIGIGTITTYIGAGIKAHQAAQKRNYLDEMAEYNYEIQKEQYEYQAKMNEYEAEMEQRESANAMENAREQEKRERSEYKRKMALQQATAAGSGVSGQSGSPLAVLGATAERMEERGLDIRRRGEQLSNRHKFRSKQFQVQADVNRVQKMRAKQQLQHTDDVLKHNFEETQTRLIAQVVHNPSGKKQIGSMMNAATSKAKPGLGKSGGWKRSGGVPGGGGKSIGQTVGGFVSAGGGKTPQTSKWSSEKPLESGSMKYVSGPNEKAGSRILNSGGSNSGSSSGSGGLF